MNEEHKTWEELKQQGSGHYKSGGIEPIDLYRSAKPHPSLSAFAVKALTDNIKYSYRMLTTKGVNESDCVKIKHYTELLIAESMQSAELSAKERQQLLDTIKVWNKDNIPD